ncbi:MAG: Gfo/Idh/MocA family oxidoreductase [Caldilineaceae bacterium]|nr:Gfo/Idh/MocA family oxidoreductase [Caldilineaceae bacterium]
MDEVRWGIIGCGNVTEVKSGPAFNKVPNSRLAMVMRRDAAKAQDYARRHGVPRWTSDADALIHDPEVNAVYIATPPDSHADYTVRAAAAGKPIYVEKPMARTAAECDVMLEVCRAADVPLFVAYYRRRLPTFLKVEEWLRAGAIGGLRTATITLLRPPSQADHQPDKPWRVQPEIAGGGYFFDLASHQLDVLDYLLGPIAQATGYSANLAGLYVAEDTVCGSFRFASGVLGTGTWCFAAAPGQEAERIELLGSAGKITFSAFALSDPIELEVGGQVERFQAEPPAHVQQPLIATVVDALLGRGDCPSTGVSAARTSRMLEQIAFGIV